jgi:hypothetical protein
MRFSTRISSNEKHFVRSAVIYSQRLHRVLVQHRRLTRQWAAAYLEDKIEELIASGAVENSCE